MKNSTIEIELKKALLDIKKIDARLANIISLYEGDTDKPLFEEMTFSEKVDYIIKGVADFYEVDQSDLLKKTNNEHVASRKKYLVKLLRDHTDSTYPYISEKLGYKNHASASVHYSNMKNFLSDAVYGDGRVKANYESILKYLGLDEQEQT